MLIGIGIKSVEISVPVWKTIIEFSVSGWLTCLTNKRFVSGEAWKNT